MIARDPVEAAAMAGPSLADILEGPAEALWKAAADLSDLTEKQREVLRLLAQTKPLVGDASVEQGRVTTLIGDLTRALLKMEEERLTIAKETARQQATTASAPASSGGPSQQQADAASPSWAKELSRGFARFVTSFVSATKELAAKGLQGVFGAPPTDGRKSGPSALDTLAAMHAQTKGPLMSLVGEASPLAYDTLTGSFRLLSAAIGETFLPVAMDASAWLQKAAAFVRGLDGSTKESIATWAKWGIVVLGTAAGVRVFLNALSMVKNVLVDLTTGWGRWVGGIGLAAAAIGGLTYALQANNRVTAAAGEDFGKKAASGEATRQKLLDPDAVVSKGDLKGLTDEDRAGYEGAAKKGQGALEDYFKMLKAKGQQQYGMWGDPARVKFLVEDELKKLAGMDDGERREYRKGMPFGATPETVRQLGVTRRLMEEKFDMGDAHRWGEWLASKGAFNQQAGGLRTLGIPSPIERHASDMESAKRSAELVQGWMTLDKLRQEIGGRGLAQVRQAGPLPEGDIEAQQANTNRPLLGKGRGMTPGYMALDQARKSIQVAALSQSEIEQKLANDQAKNDRALILEVLRSQERRLQVIQDSLDPNVRPPFIR